MSKPRLWRRLSLCLLYLLPVVVLAGCSHTAEGFEDGASSQFAAFFRSLGLNLGAGIAGAILGACVGAFFSERAKPFRKWLGWVALGLSILGSFLTSSFLSGVLGFIAGAIAAYMALRITKASLTVEGEKPKPRKTTFGSAEWADLAHLQEHDLVGKSGLALGVYQDGKGERFPLHYTGDRHLLTCAPTRSGKGVAAIVPNLLTYRGSVLVLDPKGENALITADRRGKGTASIPGLGQEVYVVDPWGITGQPQARINPMDWLRGSDEDIAENAMILADSIIMESNHADAFWSEEAKALLMGLVLYVALEEPESRRTLGRVRDIIVLPQDEFNAMLLRMGDSKNPVVRSTAARTDAKDSRLLSSVLASLQSHTHFLDSERVRASLSASDFSFADLKAGNMSVYLVLPADRISTFDRWLRLLIQQALTINARNIAEQPKLPVLFILDEMAALGKLSMLRQAYGLMAGYGMQLWGIVQDLSQLESLYGDGWQTFISNSGALQYFGSRDVKTAEYFSKLCGMQTIEKQNLSNSISHMISGHGGSSEGESITTDTLQRPLMFSDELMMMRDGKQVVLVDNFNPVPGYKVPWFENPELAKLGHNLRVEKRPPVAPPTPVNGRVPLSHVPEPDARPF